MSPGLRRLAAYLAWKQGEWVDRDVLCELLWHEGDPRRTSQSLRTTIHRLRAALQDGETSCVVETRRNAVRLIGTPACEVDARNFEATATSALKSTSSDISSLVSAADQYRGEFLADAEDSGPDGDWHYAERECLADLHRAVLRRLVERLASSDLHHVAIDYALKWRDADPLSEEPCRWLMRLYAAIGRPGRVIEEFERCRDTIEREFGVGLSDATLSERTKMTRIAAKRKPPDPPQAAESPGAPEPPQAYEPSVDPARSAGLFLVSGETKAMTGDLDGGLKMVQKARDLYEELDDPHGVARAETVLAGVLLAGTTGDRTHEVLELAQRAADYYRREGPAGDLLRASMLGAQACIELQLTERALEIAREGLALSHELGNKDAEARFQLAIGVACTATYRFPEAQEALDAVLSDLGRLYQPGDLMMAMQQRAVLASGMGDIFLAEGYTREACALADQLPPSPRSDMVRHTLRFGRMMLLHGQERRAELEALCAPPESALMDVPGQRYLQTLMLMDGDPATILASVQDWLRASLDRMPPWWNDAYIRLMIEVMLGYNFNRDALRWAGVAVRRGRRQPSDYAEAYAYFQRGVAHARLGSTKAAVRCRKRAASLSEGIESKWTPAWLALIDGLVALNRSERHGAKHYLTKSVELFQKTGTSRLAHMVERYMEESSL